MGRRWFVYEEKVGHECLCIICLGGSSGCGHGTEDGRVESGEWVRELSDDKREN